MITSKKIAARKKIEKQIVKQFVGDAIKAGYAISLDNGGDGFEFKDATDVNFVMGEMFATDEERVYLSKDGKQCGVVHMVYGNDGWDVMADYGWRRSHEDALDEIMTVASRLADKLSYGFWTN